MKIKTIKKAIAMFSLVAVSVCTFGMGTVVAQTTTIDVDTTVTQGCGGTAPIIKAKWETKDAIQFTGDSVYRTYMTDTDRDDDGPAGYTQIAPTGVYQDYIPYTVCAVVTDGATNSSGNSGLDGVYMLEVSYPQDIGFHAHPTTADKINGGYETGNTPQGEASSGYDPAGEGCSPDDGVYGNEIQLTQLTKADGIELFCGDRADYTINPGNIRDYYNGNLTYFYDSYSYNEICGTELPQEKAYVYCGTRNLYYEDPAGDYKIHVKAQNTNTKIDEETNLMTYLELQSFEVDFDSVGIDYGMIDSINQWYGPHGDDDMTTVNMPTVRNLGNVRLYIGVEQDAMGFGQQANGDYNVRFRGRIGHAEEDWYEYAPNAPTAWMEDILDLSKDRKMDFQIKISQWPSGAGSGTMTLISQDAEFRMCL